MELTIPWQEHIKDTIERKKASRGVVQQRGGKRGVREVGGRGFTDQSLGRAYNILGIMGASKQRAIKEVIEAARRLWIRRGELWVGLPGHKLRLNQLGWLTWVRTFERPNTSQPQVASLTMAEECQTLISLTISAHKWLNIYTQGLVAAKSQQIICLVCLAKKIFESAPSFI